jgi:hypothetical protein
VIRSAVKAALAAAGLVACTPAPQARYGEPVGIRIEASGRTLAVSAAVRQGEELAPHLEGLAGALARAAAACATEGEVGLDLEVRAGAVSVPRRPADGPGECLAAALDGKAVGRQDLPPLHVRLRVAPE